MPSRNKAPKNAVSQSRRQTRHLAKKLRKASESLSHHKETPDCKRNQRPKKQVIQIASNSKCQKEKTEPKSTMGRLAQASSAEIQQPQPSIPSVAPQIILSKEHNTGQQTKLASLKGVKSHPPPPPPPPHHLPSIAEKKKRKKKRFDNDKIIFRITRLDRQQAEAQRLAQPNLFLQKKKAVSSSFLELDYNDDQFSMFGKRSIIGNTIGRRILTQEIDKQKFLRTNLNHTIQQKSEDKDFQIRIRQGSYRQIGKRGSLQKIGGFTYKRPSRNIERRDYCALAGESNFKRKKSPDRDNHQSCVIDNDDPQQLRQLIEKCQEVQDLEQQEPEESKQPEVVVMRQRGRPRKGQQGIKRHAILQIKLADGIQKLEKNSEVAMIINRIQNPQLYKQQLQQQQQKLRQQQIEFSTPVPPKNNNRFKQKQNQKQDNDFTDDSYLEADTRAASEPPSNKKYMVLRSRLSKLDEENSELGNNNFQRKTPQNYNRHQRNEYQINNIVLSSNQVKINSEKWKNQAIIETPHFKVWDRLEQDQNESRLQDEKDSMQKDDALKFDELTDDQHFIYRHQIEQKQEKSREAIAQSKNRSGYHKRKQLIKQEDSNAQKKQTSKIPKKRGRPPRMKRQNHSNRHKKKIEQEQTQYGNQFYYYTHQNSYYHPSQQGPYYNSSLNVSNFSYSQQYSYPTYQNMMPQNVGFFSQNGIHLGDQNNTRRYSSYSIHNDPEEGENNNQKDMRSANFQFGYRDDQYLPHQYYNQNEQIIDNQHVQQASEKLQSYYQAGSRDENQFVYN